MKETSLGAALLLILGSSSVAVALGEVVLRLAIPAQAPQRLTAPVMVDGGSPTQLGGPLHYQPKDHAKLLVPVSNHQEPVTETLAADGFRGPDVVVPKPHGTFRVLAVGDSVVQGFSVSEDATWERVLERRLRTLRLPANSGAKTSAYEVLNGGVGGYVAWQAALRLKMYGLKYQPDLVIFHAGWNDLSYSARPDWKPGMDLTNIEEAYRRADVANPQSPRWRDWLSAHSRIVALIRDWRNRRYNANRIQEFLAKRQIDSGIPFSEPELDLYRKNLEDTYQTCHDAGIPLAVILFPSLVTPELRTDHEVLEKSKNFFEVFQLSPGEFLRWRDRYLQALRDLRKAHPDVVVIDADSAFRDLSRAERLSLFTDLVHYTEKGNQRFAEVIYDALDRAGTLPPR